MKKLGFATCTTLLALLAIVAAACGPLRGGGGEPAARIVVDNQHGPLGTVQIWVVPEVGPRTLLGNVGSARVDTLDLNIPPTGGEYRLRAEPPTGGEILSRPFRFLSGHTIVRWDLGQNSIFISQP